MIQKMGQISLHASMKPILRVLFLAFGSSTQYLIINKQGVLVATIGRAKECASGPVYVVV
jgi:hypothetical protein